MKGIHAIVFGYLFMITSSSCEKQEELPFQTDSDGVVTVLPYQWRTPLSDDGRLIHGTLSPTIQYNDGILFASQGRGDYGNMLSMLSTDNGEVRWQWDDFFEVQKNFFDIQHLHQYGSDFVFQEGRQFYHLDLSTGTTLQKKEQSYQVSRMSGLDDSYFMACNFILNKEGFYEGAILEGSVNKQVNHLLLRPEFTKDYAGASQEVGIVGSVVPFKDSDGDVLLTYDYSDPQEQGANTYVGLYNYSKQMSIYDKKPLALGIESYGSGVPIIYNNANQELKLS